MREKEKPGRSELFGFYYLGFRPDGVYKFPNVHHVAKWYGVGPEAVLRWLDEHSLSPGRLSRLQVELSGASVDLQLDAPFMEPPEIKARIEDVLDDLDQAQPGRKPWVDGPIT